jgi:hypothetical protein
MDENFSDIVRDQITAYLDAVRTAMPGIVQSYDITTNTASVQPSVNMEFMDGTITAMPQITNIPVVFPGSVNACVQFPLHQGDGVLIICSDCSLENWVNNAMQTVDPGDCRRFSLMDAFCIPGLFSPKGLGKMSSGSGLQILYKGASIIIDDNGIVNINGNSDYFTKYTELNNALANATNPASLLFQIQAELVKIATAITSLSGSYVPATLAVDLSTAKSTTAKIGG